MKPTKILLSLMFLFLGGLFFQNTMGIRPLHAETIILIVNKNVNQSQLTRQEIKDIFLGDKTTWDNGDQVTLVTLKAGTVHDEFLEEYIKKPAIVFSRYWKRLLMTGKSKLPIAFETENETLDYVTKTDGAIGYISPALLNENVKKITVN